MWLVQPFPLQKPHRCPREPYLRELVWLVNVISLVCVEISVIMVVSGVRVTISNGESVQDALITYRADICIWVGFVCNGLWY